MGKVTNDGISGLVGNLVFYKRDGKNYVRTKPASKSKKRRVMTPQRKLFGIITRHGSHMVKTAGFYFLFPLKLSAYNHMRGWMRHLYQTRNEGEWPISSPDSGMCQLNQETDLRDVFKPSINVNSINKVITVSIPSLDPVKDIIAPPGTKEVRLQAVAVTSPFTAIGQVSHATAEYIFPYVSGLLTEKQVILDAKAAAGDIAIVFITLSFVTRDTGTGNYLRDLKWLPGAAVAMGKV